jgi:hypothetical protein
MKTAPSQRTLGAFLWKSFAMPSCLKHHAALALIAASLGRACAPLAPFSGKDSK